MIRQIELQDHPYVIDLFFKTIEDVTSYISHGEIQMGLHNITKLDSRSIWESYLISKVDPLRMVVEPERETFEKKEQKYNDCRDF